MNSKFARRRTELISKYENVFTLTGLAFLGAIRIGERFISTTAAIHLRVELGVADTASQTPFVCPAAMACT